MFAREFLHIGRDVTKCTLKNCDLSAKNTGMKENVFTNMLPGAGMTPQQVAQMLASRGCGDADAILKGIENKDEKALSFLPKMAKEIAEKNPALFNSMCAKFGVKNPFHR